MGCLCRQPVGEPTRCSARRILWWATIIVAHRNGMKLLPSELIGVISRSNRFAHRCFGLSSVSHSFGN